MVFFKTKGDFYPNCFLITTQFILHQQPPLLPSSRTPLAGLSLEAPLPGESTLADVSPDQKLPLEYLTPGLAKGHCLAVYSMSKEIIRLYRKSGPLFTGQYLKTVAFMLQWYVGGDRTQRPSMKTYVSLTRSGLPRFIPPFYRKRLRKDYDPYVIQVVLSVCTLHRMMRVPPKGGLRIDPTTIHIPGFKLKEEGWDICRWISTKGYTLLARYVPSFPNIPLKMGYSFKPMFSSGPNTYKDPCKESKIRTSEVKGGSKLTVYHTLPMDAAALSLLFKPEQTLALGSMWFYDRLVFGGDGHENPVEFNREGLSGFRWLLASLVLPNWAVWWDFLKTPPELGRFGRKLEGAGKVRLFAIVCPLLQTLIRPLHEWTMEVLSCLRTDGTFDQPAPLNRLSGLKDLFSFDLKSATDLLPVDLSRSLLGSVFGNKLAYSWSFMMTNVGFRSPDWNPKPTNIRVYRFTRGQPLGYYSSWPVFTLTHHMLVWIAAERVYPGKQFWNYAILGDDIVIGDSQVAREYSKIMDQSMGVISKEKSLISDSGCCEFAKRFIIRNHRSDRMDVSPLSIPLIRSLSGFSAAFVFKKLGCSFMNSFRLKGGGYRVYSRIRDPWSVRLIFPQLSRRWKRHCLSMFSPSGIQSLPLELWLVFPNEGCLDCYSKGAARSLILELVRPRDIDEESINEVRRFWDGDNENMFERHLKSFITLHLEYVKWYAGVILDFDLPLGVLINPPIAPRRLKRVSDENEIRRYGLIYKVWDFLHTKNRRIGILGQGENRRLDVIDLRLFRGKIDWRQVVIDCLSDSVN